MSVLVTGGCGLIGATLARMLVEAGETVTVFDRAAVPARFAGIDGRVRIIQGELGTFSHVLDAVAQAKPGAIFHLGAVLSIPANADPPSAFDGNVRGIFHVLEAARILGVPRVRFTSTTATYGLDLEGPTIGDRTLQRPSTLYGATKLFGELLGRFYATRYGLDFRAVRFPAGRHRLSMRYQPPGWTAGVATSLFSFTIVVAVLCLQRWRGSRRPTS